MTSEPIGTGPVGPSAIQLPRALVRWGPVLLAFVAVRLYLLAAAAAHGMNGSDPRTWARWDSFQYLSIAVEGYRLGVSDGHNSGYPPGTPIGNTAWMPAYPLLMRAGYRAGASMVSTGWGLSAAFALLMLRAIDRLVPDAEPAGRRTLLLLLAAFFPGFVYAHAVFPISMEVLLLAVSIRLTAAGRWTAGGVAGAAAAFTYTSGDLIGPVMGVWAVIGTGTAGRDGMAGAWRRGTRMLLPALLPVAGLCVVLAVQRVATGHWDALFRIQSRYDVRLTNPFAELWRLLKFVNSPDRAQVPVVALLVLALVGATASKWPARPPVDRLLAIAAVAYWIVPLSLGANVSPWRAMALLTPFVPPLARRLPTPVLWATLAVFAVLGWAMCGRFLDNTAI